LFSFTSPLPYILFLIPAAKNLVLAGVKSVTLHDDGKADLWDLSSNFFLSEKDVGQNRAQACVPKLQELNNAVIISTITGDLTKEQLSNFQVHEHEMICGVHICIVKKMF
jgi:molybdopterin/thiamine biosynthesis adenylyltransferase